MAGPDYSGPRQYEIRRQQNRQTRIVPDGVDINIYYGIYHQIVVGTREPIAFFIHWRTGTVYF